jgi:hypothetical protein
VVTEHDEAAALVAEALVILPGFEWDDQDLNDCAHAAVQALEAAGWRPPQAKRTTETKGEET